MTKHEENEFLGGLRSGRVQIQSIQNLLNPLTTPSDETPLASVALSSVEWAPT